MSGSWPEPLLGKWFLPIAERLEAFEANSNIFPEFESVAHDDSPEWLVKCAWTQMKPHSEVSGLERLDRIRARNIGAMIGSKTSMCKRFAGGNLWFNQLPTKQQERLEELFGRAAIEEAKETWSRFAVEIQPEFKRVRRFAMELVMSQNLGEQVQFHQGVANGLTFMDRIGGAVRRTSKRQADSNRRSLVYMFAIEHWEVIEAARKDISWSDLVDQVDKEHGMHVQIDEETFKKILQRTGLTIGKIGRPRKQ